MNVLWRHLGGGVHVSPINPRAQAMLSVSVVIPCYNYGACLEECVRSALEQRGVDVDVTIIDDGSTDDSVAVASRLASADSRVQVVQHETNQGHLATANQALSFATADYVVKLDADDLLAPGSLARSAALLEQHPEVSFVYGWAEFFEGETPDVVSTPADSWTIWTSEQWLEKVLRRAHNVIAQPEIMIRRSALLNVGGYRSDLEWAEDYNLWLRLATVGSVGRVNGSTQGLYRIHSQSFQRSHRDLRLSDLRGRVAATRRYVEGLGPGSEERTRLALACLAADTRRLLATRADEDDPSPDMLAEYERIAAALERESGSRPLRGPLVWGGMVGRQSRRMYEILRWRRWRATGV